MNNRRPSPAAAEPSETDRPWPPNLIGQARIIDMAFRGEDLMPLITSLSDRVHADPNDAAALMDLASIHIVLRKSEHGFVFQQAALGIERVYRQPIGSATAGALRVLMFIKGETSDAQGLRKVRGILGIAFGQEVIQALLEEGDDDDDDPLA